MPSIPLHPPSSSRSSSILQSLPPLIQTPSGLALLEIQGTLHTSATNFDITSIPSLHDQHEKSASGETSIGRIVFPNYNASTLGAEGPGWMTSVHLYVGKHQRLPGEVKKLAKPVALLQKKPKAHDTHGTNGVEDVNGPEETGEEVEIVEIVKFKILFAGRPEPVGN